MMGEGNALGFALSGRVLDAEEALRTELVSRVVEDPVAAARDIASGEFDELIRAHADDVAGLREEYSGIARGVREW